MKLYILTMFVLVSLEALASLVYLSRNEIPPRTTGTLGFNVFFDTLLAIWAAYLLFSA